MLRLAVLVVACTGCISPVMTFGGGKSAKQAQRDTMGEFTPVQLDIEGGYRGTVQTAVLRVYADDTYRAQNVHWQRTFGEILEYTNAVLGPMYGVTLRADYRAWNHHPGAGRLTDALSELIALDDGEAVFGVVGLTSSLSLVTATFEELGYATVNGKHVVMRGYADLEERKTFTAAFPDLEAAEREQVLAARRAHKNATILLHELGHNLGVEHDDEDTIMAAMYSHRAATFTPASRATIVASIDQRLGRKPAEARPAVASAPRPTVTKTAAITVVVTEGSEIVVDGAPLAVDKLGGVFAAAAARDANTEVIIQRTPKTPASRLMDVVDTARSAGLSNLTLGD